jgi:hypothetical protein
MRDRLDSNKYVFKYILINIYINKCLYTCVFMYICTYLFINVCIIVHRPTSIHIHVHIY